MKIRSIYDGEQDSISQATGLKCPEPGRTKQSEKDSCDINIITKRYEKTGSLPEMIQREPRYGDFSNVPTFQEALEVVSLAEEQFAALDAHIRTRFGNDPAQFLAFATDKSNLEEMVKLGLATKVDVPTPAPSAPSEAPARVAPAVEKTKGA